MSGRYEERLKVYNLISYQIGDYVYSLNDIEHGILRGNKSPPLIFSRQPFDKIDPRLEYTLPIDPRIHFALNCGAKSCPAISFYRVDDIDRQLDIATRAYLQDISVDSKNEIIFLPMLFKWYRDDFGSNDREILSWIRNYIPEELGQQIQQIQDSSNSSSSLFSSAKVNIKYLSYDWGLDYNLLSTESETR